MRHMSEIIIEAKAEDTRRQKIKVSLVGRDYTIIAPKAGLAISSSRAIVSKDPEIQMKAVTSFNHWIEVAFGEHAEEIFDRLDDQDDDLDLVHIQELQEAVMGQAAGNPTTSSPGSRASRRSTGPTSRVTR